MQKNLLKILHIEDDEGDALAVERFFLQEFGAGGCQLVHVTSLTEAMQKLQHEPYDAVLLDLNLNNQSGLSNLQIIKEQHPDLPIVVLSGYDDNETALSAVRSGAQEYIVKGHTSSRMLGLAVRSSIERKKYERLLYKQASYDELTGLYNRRMFLDYLKQTLVKAERWKRQEAIMFMDANGFKQVNDLFGHDVGDLLLQQIAARLKIGLRASDFVARFGGDEFIVHLDTDIKISLATCSEVAEKLIALFKDPINIAGHNIVTGLSMGFAFFPEHGRDTSTLIQSADSAMYKSKKSGSNFRLAERI